MEWGGKTTMGLEIIQGERVARQGRVSVGCAAVIFDAPRERILLTRREDNGCWCLPSGRLEPGESVTEACARELLEETGLVGRVGRLIGVYSSPDRLMSYPDGNRYHVVGLCFEVEPIGGALALSDETTAYGYFSPDEIAAMDVLESHRERIADAFAGRPETMVR